MPNSDNLCQHEITIGKLEQAILSIKENLDDVKRSQHETVRILERISSQETRINKLEDDQEEVFVRLRKVELDTNTLAVKTGMYSAGIGAIIATVITSAVKHFF